MAKTATGIDIGSRTALALKGRVQGNTFAVSRFAVGESARSGGDGWAALAQALPKGFGLGAARVGLSGPDLNIRYTRVPRVPDWQLRKLMRFEVEEVGDTSGSEVASDFNVLPELPEIEGEDVVLLAMAREALLERAVEGVAAAGGRLDCCTPNAIALYNAWLRFGVVLDDTVLVANIGHQDIDVVIARGQDLLFARSLGGGAKLFDEALAARLGLSVGKAEAAKHELVDLAPDARHADALAEKASRACMGPAGQLLSLLQSTVMFCKSQVRITGLELDRVVICGGGAALQGLDRYLAGGLNVPVELFDAFQVVDLSGLPPEEAASLEDHALEAVVALGLAATASDPASYGIEILPRSLAKKREFWQGSAFLVAAALAAVGYLGWRYWALDSFNGEVEQQVRALSGQYTTAQRAHKAAERFVQENEVLAARATDLELLAGSGEQLGRVVDVLGAALPKGFWVTRLVAAESADLDLGMQRGEARPVVRIEGRTRPGTDRVPERFGGLVDALAAGVPGARLKPSLNPSASVFVIELTTLAAPAPGADDATDDQAGEGAAEE